MKVIENGGWSSGEIDVVIEKIAKSFEYKDNTNWAGLDPVKWKDVAQSKNMAAVKRISCPEELKEAYRAIKDVREALLKLERSLY